MAYDTCGVVRYAYYALRWFQAGRSYCTSVSITTATPDASFFTGALAPCKSPARGMASPLLEMRAPTITCGVVEIFAAGDMAAAGRKAA